jgi:hypothetical protein
MTKQADPAPPLPVESHHKPPASPVDVGACVEHLLTAIALLTRAAGSPPDVMHELAEVRRLLGKE